MKENTTTTTTVSNATQINTLKCNVCYQKVVVPAGAKNVTCTCCGQTLEVRLFPKLEEYVRGLGLTAGGNDTLDIDDQVAVFLRGVDVEVCYELVTEALKQLPVGRWFGRKMKRDFERFTGGLDAFFHAKYEHLNVGMQRMNLGNVLRGAYKRAAK